MARIALDAMGGDNAPDEIVAGAVDAVTQGHEVVLVGDAPRLEAVLAGHPVALPIEHAPQHVAMGDDPTTAIREKKGASISVAARLVRSGEAAGMVSAGSTGAALAAAAIIIGRIRGVGRPAIATLIPLGSPAVILDSGANVDVKPENLAQFGLMGSVLAQVYLGLARPRVGLLNIGEEKGKGRDLDRAAYDMLSALPIDFVGNVEGRDIGSGGADVFVTDGFTGNMTLKTIEGTARVVAWLVLQALGQDESSEFQQAVATVMPSLLRLQHQLDPESYGGAHLVGTRGVVVIAHGSSSRRAIANAIAMAAEGVNGGLVEKVGAVIDG